MPAVPTKSKSKSSDGPVFLYNPVRRHERRGVEAGCVLLQRHIGRKGTRSAIVTPVSPGLWLDGSGEWDKCQSGDSAKFGPRTVRKVDLSSLDGETLDEYLANTADGPTLDALAAMGGEIGQKALAVIAEWGKHPTDSKRALLETLAAGRGRLPQTGRNNLSN